MNDDKFRLPNAPAPPAMPGVEVPERTTLLRIGPRPDNLTKAETEVLTDEKRRLIDQVDSGRNP
jgi:proline-rich tail region repeat protein